MSGWFSRLFGPPKPDSESGEIALAPSPSEKQSEKLTDRPAPHADNERATTPTVPWMQREAMSADFLDWLFDSSTDVPLFSSPQENNIIAALEKILASQQSGADLVRRLPGVLPLLLQSLRTEDFSGAELARKISHDVVLVEAVIRLANSALYSTGETISSIEHAILVLGHTGLRQLVTSVAFKPIIDLKSGYYTRTLAPRIWEQSEKCARLTVAISESSRIEPLQAFLAGLILHVGLIVSLRFIDQMTEDKHDIGSIGFRRALAGFGRCISANIAREWNFPAAIVLAIEEQAITSHRAEVSELGGNLGIADYVCKMRILAEHDRVDIHDQSLRRYLPPAAIACLDHGEDCIVDPTHSDPPHA